MKHPNRINLSFSIELSPYLELLISDLSADLGGVVNIEGRSEDEVFLECIFPLSELAVQFKRRIQKLTITTGDENE